MAQKKYGDGQVVQSPKSGETVVIYAQPYEDIPLSAEFEQADVQLDGDRVVFEFENGGKVILEFTDLGSTQNPNIVMPDGTLLSVQEFLVYLADRDVEPAAGPDGASTLGGGVGEYDDDAGSLLGGVDSLDGLDASELSTLLLDEPDFESALVDLDDQPVANPDKIVLGSIEASSVNLVLILDQSGSMSSGNRMPLMKDAVANLIDTYGDALESVMVVPFSTGASVFKVDGSVWLDPAEAVAKVNSLFPTNLTSYDAAVATVMNEWSAPSTGEKTYVYFLSDGGPTSSIDGDDTSGERGAWVDFLEQSGIEDVYAVGIGVGVSVPPLLTVAWSPDGMHGSNVFPVEFETDLSAVLTEISLQASGNVLANDDPGDDGLGDPAMVSVEYGGTEFTFNLNGDPESYVIDLGPGRGTFYIESDGDYVYSPPAGGVGGNPWVINYTMQDSDGSQSSSVIIGPDPTVQDTSIDAMLQQNGLDV
jgi:hypothetical protein